MTACLFGPDSWLSLRQVPRNIPAKTGRVIVYRYQPEDYDAAPVAAASIFPPLGKWVLIDAGEDHVQIDTAVRS
eukprot:SAG31_NODE_6699_length_1919_cov_2.099451_3_plen_74_part_00